MMKKLLTLLMILPLLVYCAGNKEEPVPDNDKKEEQKQDEEKKDDEGQKEDPTPDGQDEDDETLYADAAPELKSGDIVQATNPIVEKFLNEVDYPDRTHGSEVLNYYGGFNGIAYNENGEEDPSGVVLNWDTAAYYQHPGIWPDGDKPMKYSIRWKKADLDDEVNPLNLHMEDKLGWKGDIDVTRGSVYAEITNLVPNDEYSYRVTTATGKVLAEGSFKTKASSTLHQCFFTGATKKAEAKSYQAAGGRNCRDLGGWPTLDGKTVKYRKIYRGGRLNEKWQPFPLNKQGEREVLFEGIGAEIDLRGSDDIIKEPAVKGLEHCHPVIEEGGKVMLGVANPSNYNCAKWLAFDVEREDMKGKTKDELKAYSATEEELAAFQVAYRAKMKELFEFVLTNVRNNKPVHFHCSLGRDRTGTLDVILLGLLGVREGIIAKEYEVTYFAPVGYCVSSSDTQSNPEPIFNNTSKHWVYSDIVPYFWEKADEVDGTFAAGIQNYLTNIVGVPQADIDEFRKLMLE